MDTPNQTTVSIRVKPWCILLLILVIFFGSRPDAGAEVSEANPVRQSDSQLYIAPSSSKLAGGTAKLDAGPLRRDGSAYVGGYEIKVIPYFFKNETGRLFIHVPTEAFDHMVDGLPTSFTGRATTSRTGQTRKVTARATPSANDHGDLTFTVATDNGPLVFNTSYRIGRH